MRVLLLYVSRNSGHQRAAMAIEKALRETDSKTETAIFNYLGYVCPVWEKIVTHIYFSLIKTFPGMWNRLYDHVGVSKGVSPLTRRINKRQSEKFNRFLRWFNPDVVVCTQAFPCGVVANFKKREAKDLRLIAVATDYIAHVYWIYEEVDIYVVASEEARMDLIGKGVDSKKIKVLGIPIDSDFAQKNERRRVAASLGLSPEKMTVLIIGGGQGYGPMEDVFREIIKLNLDAQIIIIAGTNELLQKRLAEISWDIKGIKIFGFVTNVSEIMDACDVVVTKPGGLTTAEAIAKGLPMILTLPIPGQEEKNRDFFLRTRMALVADTPADAGKMLRRFAEERGLLEEYKKNVHEKGRPRASLDIADEVLHAGIYHTG